MQRQSKGIMRLKPKQETTAINISAHVGVSEVPIVNNTVDDIYVFYTPNGRLVQSTTYDEAHAKWLLTKETD